MDEIHTPLFLRVPKAAQTQVRDVQLSILEQVIRIKENEKGSLYQVAKLNGKFTFEALG